MSKRLRSTPTLIVLGLAVLGFLGLFLWVHARRPVKRPPGSSVAFAGDTGIWSYWYQDCEAEFYTGPSRDNPAVQLTGLMDARRQSAPTLLYRWVGWGGGPVPEGAAPRMFRTRQRAEEWAVRWCEHEAD